ncbi:putative surface protein with fasciclin (FAS1) repeats [Marinobacter sp. LV10R520-4]|uniref:fasciclin domain-containing protein n=1 Tax=Marinobacter sp. LV10R520-4 TaxID=1761796 RepID=UPI000C004E4D|nr:fasciclin domain-containing protein [Marinobacter sp. LV10R520-4]PFG51650.1 putative surface protein with fasciclin (FAS1) repeats [Marinobacter sp. LV10R520-4]
MKPAKLFCIKVNQFKLIVRIRHRRVSVNIGVITRIKPEDDDVKKTGIVKSLVISSLMLGAAVVALPAFAENHKMGKMDSMNIVEKAVETESLSTLVAAVKAAGLVETLSGEGPFTVFAPTNEAFAKLPAGTVETLLKPENKEQLQSILTYHVLATKAPAAAAIKMVQDGGGSASVATVQGDELTFSLEGDSLMIEDSKGNMATVVAADLMQSNGVVHVIDTVLMP